MRVLITGATGFVGSHLRKHLAATTDWEIVGIARTVSPKSSEAAAGETLVPLDMQDAAGVRSLLDDIEPDFIVHLAAQSHVPTAYDDPWSTLENNIRGQLNLLQSSVSLGHHSRILVVGSGQEYGRAAEQDLPLVEDHPLRPENPYSVSKVAQDVLGYQYFASYDLPVLRVRPFNHVGPGQSERFVLPAFASQVAQIEAGVRAPILEVGNLTPARDFTDVRDVVRAYRLLLESGSPGEVYNVASGRARTIQSLVDRLRALSTVDIEVRVDPDRYRPADIPIIYGDAGKLEADTGWRPEIAIDQTIEDVLNEWRDRTRHPINPN